MDASNTQQNPLIFIAYDLADVRFVERICASLRNMKHSISLPKDDENRRRTGYQNKAMRVCKVMLVVCSPESIQKSRTVRHQVEHFDWLERPIIALDVRAVEKEEWFVPLSTAKKVDFRQSADDSEYARALGELDSTLKHLYQSLRLPASFLFRPTEPSAGLPSPQPAEIVEIYPEFPLERFENWVKESSHKIRIADNWTPVIGTQDEELGKHGQAFGQAAKHGVQSEILLLNPASPIARRRSLDLRLHGYISQELNSKEVSNIGFRLYSTLPSYPIYVVDENLLFGQYPYGRRAFAAPWFQVQRGSALYQTIMDEFESRWKDATDYARIQWQIDLLNAKEITVLRHLALGYQVPYISKEMNFSPHTMRGIVKVIYEKLDVLHLPQRGRRVAAINKARELGIID